MNDIEKAKSILRQKKYTFVLVKDGQIGKTSYQRGIIPFLDLIKNNPDLLRGATIADKVIGRAAALLAAGYKVEAIFGEVISCQAIQILDEYAIFYQFGHCVKVISNREKSGQCPMEKLTRGLIDPQLAYQSILGYYKDVLKMDLS